MLWGWEKWMQRFVNEGEVIQFLYCSSQRRGSVLFLVADDILTDEAGSLSSLLTEAGRALNSLGLVILPEGLLDPILGES